MNADERVHKARKTKLPWLRYIRLMPKCYWFDAICCKGVDIPVHYPFYQLRKQVAASYPRLYGLMWNDWR